MKRRKYHNFWSTTMASLALTVSQITGAGAITTTLGKMDVPAFEAANKSGKIVLLGFHTNWCPICTRQYETMKKIAESDKNVAIMNVDFDGDKAANKQYGVNAQSTLIVFHNGKEIGRVIGVFQEAPIRALLARA